MNKQGFIAELSHKLQALPQQDLQDSLDYYSEMIDDRIESGMSEEEAVADLGSPETVANDILLNMPLPKIIRTKCKPKKSLGAFEIILLILGSPLWIALLLALIIIILSVYIALWAVITSLWIVDLSLLLSSIAMFYSIGLTIGTSVPTALLFFGLGIGTLGFTGLFFFVCLKVTTLFAKLSVSFMKWIKKLIIGKENK